MNDFGQQTASISWLAALAGMPRSQMAKAEGINRPSDRGRTAQMCALLASGAPSGSGCVPLGGRLLHGGNYRGNYPGDGRSKFKFKMLSSFKMKSNGNQEMPVNAGLEIKRANQRIDGRAACTQR